MNFGNEVADSVREMFPESTPPWGGGVLLLANCQFVAIVKKSKHFNVYMRGILHLYGANNIFARNWVMRYIRNYGHEDNDTYGK